MTLEASTLGIKGQVMRPDQMFIRPNEHFRSRPELAAHLMTLMADVVSAPMINVKLKMPRREMIRERLEFSTKLAGNAVNPDNEQVVNSIRQRFHDDAQLHMVNDADLLQAFWLGMFEDARSRGKESLVDAERLRTRLMGDYLEYANRRHPIKPPTTNV